jgi:hypothetical protein
MSIDVPFTDPMFTTGHRMAAAAIMAGGSEAEAEKVLYGQLFSREEHYTPKNKKEHGGVKEKSGGGRTSAPIRKR